MGTAFLYGNGGGIDNLKFRVYSATSLPASGKENDVCIITSTPISTWEVSDADNPTWNAPARYVYLTSVISNWSESPNLLRKNTLYLKLIRCWQYENGTWSTKNAYQYQNGEWVQFSSEFTATINVTYPAGSTCTATDGTTTLTAPDTSGTWACVVPNTGTWTITATDGANTKSEAVSITTDGQSVSLTLSYRHYLYNYLDGQTAYDGITGGWNHYETVDGCVSIVHTSLNQEAFTRCASKIDFSGYTTLYIESYRYDNTSSESGVSYAIGTQTDTTIFSWGAIKGGFGGSRKAWSTWSIDVSSLTESAYFAFWGYYEKAAIRAMWLE